MSPLFGINVISSPYAVAPRFQISPEAPMTDAFRTEMNDWCRRFFGEEPVVYMVDSSYLDPLAMLDVSLFGRKRELSFDTMVLTPEVLEEAMRIIPKERS